MLSADVASLEKIHFSTFHSSMSAVVQELYTGLPANLSTELTALSDPTVVLGAKPGTSTFVLSCSSLPSEHQRTHGLKICPQDSVEKLDCTGKVSCPELMDLLSEDPSGTGRLVENDEIQNKSIMELDYLQGCLSKDARMAKDMGDIAKEGLAQHPLTSKETCWSKEKESQLIQEGRGFLSSSPCIETAGLPQSLDENQAKVQVTPENLSDPMKEAPGMKADGTRLFSKAGEPSARVSTGVPPQSSECSDVDTVMGKVAVSGTDTLVSLEPVILMDNVSTKEQLQEEEEGGGDGKGLAACVTLSAVGDALSSSDAGGEKFPNQDEEVNAILDNCPPALQDKMSLHENNSSALVLESSITVDIQASNTSSETSGLLFEGSLEFGNALWEQNTDLFEVICEMQEGGCSVTREESLKSNTSEQTEELVEEWASGQHVGETPSQTWSGEELPSDSDNEQEMDSCNDHSYSCAYERVVEIQKGAAVQRRWKAIQEKSQLENGTFAVPTEQFAVAKTMHPENNMRPLPPSPKGHPEDGFRPSYSGTDNTLIPLEEANNFGCFQNSCNVSMNSHPACHDALGADTELSDKSSVQMESNSDPRAEIPKIVSAVMHLHATNSSSTVDVSLATDEEHPQTTQLCNELLFTQQADLTLGSSLFLDTLHRERLPGTCAKLGRESFLRPNKKELASRGQNSGSWARGKKLSLSNFAQVLSEESQNWTALVLKDAENRASDMETVQSKVCTPRDDLCSAVETCSTMSGSISDDDDDDDDVDDIKVRTETTTEDSDGLEMHHTSVFDREALHPQKCGSGKVWNGHPCGNNWSGLDGAESVKAETLESDAEAESQRADGDNSSVNSEDVPNANASVFHPSVKIYGGSQRTGLSGKLTCDRGLEQTTHPLEIGILVKDQSKKEQERYQVHPCHRPSAAAATPDLSRLKNDQTSGSPGHAEQQRCSFILCSKDPGQPRETVCQNKMQSVVYQNDFNSLDLFNQKNEVPEIDVAECQQPALMLSKKQEADRSVTLSTEEMQRTVKCNQNPLPFPERGQGLTPPAPVLVIENGVQETLQRSLAGDGAFNKMVSELIDNPFKEETIELKSLKPCLRSLECAPKLLKLNGIDKGQAQQTKTDEFHSASETSSRNPSDVLDENPFLKFNSKPASTPSPAFFQQDPLTFTTSDGQTSAEGEYSKSFGNKGIPCLTCMCSAAHSVQNPGICISQKYEPPLKGLWSPLAKGHPAGAMPLEGEAGHPIHQFTLENEKASCLAGEGTHVDSPLDNEEIPVSTGGSKRGAGGVREVISVIFHSPDSSKEMKHSLEEDQSESGRTDETMGLLPVSSRSHPKNSSAALLQALKFAVAGKETAFPFYVEIHIRPSLAHLPAHTSELGLRKAKGPSKAAVVKWHSRDKQNTLQAQHSVPTRWSLETLWHTRSWASLGGSVSESFPRCLRSKRRRRVGLESKQELAGDQRPPLQGQWASCSVAAPIETEGAAAPGRRAEPSAAPAAASCAAARREDRAEEEEERRAQRRLKRRRGAAQHPAGSSSREAAGKRVDLALRSLAGGSGGGGEGCGGRSSCSTFWEPERPPEAKALTGAAAYRPAGSPSLCFRDRSWQPARRETPAAAFCTLPPAAGSRPEGSHGACGLARHVRGPLLLRRRPGKGCWGKVPAAGQFMGAREGRLLPSSTSPKSPSQIAARHRFQLLGAVSLPARPAGLSSHGTVASWAQPPKQSGSRSSSLGSSRLRSRAKEPAVLFRRLSALADSLLAPRRDPQALKPRLHSTQLLPVTATHSQLRIKKLQEMVSCTKMKLSAAWVNGGRCCCRFEVFSSQPTALYPIASASLCFFELSNRTPLAFSAPVFPVSFHVKMDSRPGRTLSGVTPLHSIPSSLALGEARTVQSPKWTFSFLLPQRCLSTAPIQNEAWIPAESYTPSAQSLSAAKERGREAAAVAPSCPTRGLQTALALFSPGCYRVWTRKRNLSSRLPAAQKLTLLQLPRGVKGLKCPTPVSADLFPLLPSSLGRGLCPWSQHGPSTCPSEFTPLHSNRCKWQPSTRRSLRNRTCIAESSAPLSLVRDPFMEASRAVDDAMRLKPSFAAPLPMSCSVPEPAPSPALGFPVPGFQVHPLDELDVSVPAVPKAGARLGKAELEKRPKKVSQIRIRKTVPKPDPNLTPMGLPRPKRLKKTEFSLEEIYTNKNYKSPPTTRCLETIFEEPKEKNGSLISVSQQKRKRILEFQDFTVPRKRKARNRVKVMGSFTRAQKAAMEGRELDVLLLQKLTDLEMFFAKEEEQEQASGS